MKKPPNDLSEPIATNFVTADLLPEAFRLDVQVQRLTADDVPRIARALEWNEKEWCRLEKEAVERFEQLFRLHEVDRTGDDASDFPRLAFRLVEKLAPRADIGKKPEKIGLFFELYEVTTTGNIAYDFMRLIGRLTEEIHPGFETVNGPQPGRLKRNNPRTLLLLLADVETVKQKLRPQCADIEAIRYLIKNEPFNSQWGGVREDNLANWLCEAVNPEKNPLWRLWESHRELGTLPRLIETIQLVERGENHH